jgi:hypothetical protein
MHLSHIFKEKIDSKHYLLKLFRKYNIIASTISNEIGSLTKELFFGYITLVTNFPINSVLFLHLEIILSEIDISCYFRFFYIENDVRSCTKGMKSNLDDTRISVFHKVVSGRC